MHPAKSASERAKRTSVDIFGLKLIPKSIDPAKYEMIRLTACQWAFPGFSQNLQLDLLQKQYLVYISEKGNKQPTSFLYGTFAMSFLSSSDVGAI